MFFFDESRFGTHSKLGHGWFPTGERTQVAVKLGFANFYLYSAIEPRTGESFTPEIPNVNAICMSVFLEEFAKEYPNEEIILVMDGAGWHKSKDLQIPDTIEIILLPPYSPELNPVTILAKHQTKHDLKQSLRNAWRSKASGRNASKRHEKN